MNTHSPRAARLPRAASVHQGFTLLEVMISVIVLTLGLLSVAGLTARSLAAADSSGYRATAAQMALSMADRIRAARQEGLDGLCNVTYGASVIATGPFCSAAVAAWKLELASLPLGDGQIAVVTAAGATSATVTVKWNDRRAGVAVGTVNQYDTYAYTFRL